MIISPGMKYSFKDVIIGMSTVYELCSSVTGHVIPRCLLNT